MPPDPEKLQKNTFDLPDYVEQLNNDEMEIEDRIGYLPLNQEGDSNNYFMVEDEESDFDDSDNENEYIHHMSELETNSQTDVPNATLPTIRRHSSELAAAVWNESSTSTINNIEITREKSEQITQIMSNIKLPNAPSWLNEISSENIAERIKNRESDAVVGNK